MKCEICHFEKDNVREHDDSNGRPYLICDECWDVIDTWGIDVPESLVECGKQ